MDQKNKTAILRTPALTLRMSNTACLKAGYNCFKRMLLRSRFTEHTYTHPRTQTAINFQQTCILHGNIVFTFGCGFSQFREEASISQKPEDKGHTHIHTHSQREGGRASSHCSACFRCTQQQSSRHNERERERGISTAHSLSKDLWPTLNMSGGFTAAPL